jgi:hypothetical protein
MGAATRADWGGAATPSGLGGEAGHLIPQNDQLNTNDSAAFSIRRHS